MTDSRFLFSTVLVFLGSLHGAIGQARADWPNWRGPSGDGISTEHAPVDWDVESRQNVRWKVSVPGKGHASPIVVGDHLFLVTCIPDRQERVLLCFDRNDGTLRWQQVVLRSPLESKHALNSHASGTPATDGESVFVTFQQVDGKRKVLAPNVGTPRQITPGVMVVASYGIDGKLNWRKNVGDFISAHGYCSCPVLYRDMVIINGDHDGESYIVALRKSTGEIVWKRPRKHKTRSYVTPIIRNINGRDEMVLSGSQCIVSLDPQNGEEYWRVEGPTEQFVASMVFDGSLFFMTCGYPDYYVMGIRPGGEGDVSDTHVAWQNTNARCYVPSPVVVDGYLFVADDRGTVNCYRADDGSRAWKSRLGNGYSASLISAQGLVYLIANNGKTTIVRPSEKLDVVAENELNANVSASPAVSNGQLFVRTEDSLICIGE